VAHEAAANRSEFDRTVPEGPFYGYNRLGAKKSEAIIANWWRQGMMCGAKAHYDGIVAFSQTDFTEDGATFIAPHLPQCFLQVCSLTYFLHESACVGWAFGFIHRRGRFDVSPSRLPGFTRRLR